jgi:hypothetical protein
MPHLWLTLATLPDRGGSDENVPLPPLSMALKSAGDESASAQ